MLRFYFSLLLVAVTYCFSAAQNCGCDHTITQSGIYRPASQGSGPFYLNVQPGQTICIQNGSYTFLRFIGFQGSATAPIKVKNCGGLVKIAHSSYYAALDFQGCRYFHVTGTGDPAINYGIRIDSCGTASAFAVGAKSSDFEVDHIEVAKAGFAGMMIKTDPNCDSTTWRANFTMYNVNVHHNYMHHTGGEGFYIGNSFYSGYTVNCNGQSTVVYPHNILGLKIHHNVVDSASAECIQYACAPDALVYDNVSTNCGIAPFAAYQNNGIQCGGGAGGKCYNNVVRGAGASGLAILGHLGNNRFFNNVLINCGGDGIFCDDRPGSLPNTYCDFLNNTIVNSGRDAIRLYNQNNSIKVYNNVMVKTGSGNYVVTQQGAAPVLKANYQTQLINAPKFVDLLWCRPKPISPLIDRGFNCTSLGVTFDRDNNLRPLGAKFDKGAYEFVPLLNKSGLPDLPEKATARTEAELAVHCWFGQDNLMVQFDEHCNGAFSVAVFDANGKMLHHSERPCEMLVALPLEGILNGIYFVEIQKDSQRRTKTVLKY